LQALTTTAGQNKLANDAAYKSWVASHSDVEVFEANKARKSLNRLKASSKGLIKDDRLPKRPATAFALYTKSRWQSGDFAGRPAPEAAKAIAQEWKGLSNEQRQVCTSHSYMPMNVTLTYEL
jgi:hypothetical protein